MRNFGQCETDEEGRGRRGAAIFFAGDASKQFAPKTLALERYPVAKFLSDTGFEKTTVPNVAEMTTWEKITEVWFDFVDFVA